MAKRGQKPFMTRGMLDLLREMVQLEIEFAFSVENGGRYGRDVLRDRMRHNREKMDDIFTKYPVDNLGLGDDDGSPSVDVVTDLLANHAPSNVGEDDDDDEALDALANEEEK